VLPWIILAAVAVPLLVAGFAMSRRSTASGEHPPGETDGEQGRVEQEFEDAEAYQEQWREKEHKEHPPESLY
jgi:hypothetical protein